MDKINTQVANLLREQIKVMRKDHLVKLDSERILGETLGIGRQRIRAVIQQLTSEGLLIKHEGKGTYITPIIKNKYLNLICSPDIKSNDPFYNNLLVELTNFAAKESVNIVPINMETLKNGFSSCPTLMVGRFTEENLAKLKAEFPTLIAFENYPEEDSLNQIYFDHFKIGFNAVKTLYEYGHRNIIHLTGPNRYASSNLRRDGFIKCSQKLGVNYTVMSGKMNFAGGYKAGNAVAQLIRQQHYTAAFVANDWMAVGLMQYLKENGIQIPEDISVIGVDNISLASQISPTLTTYALDMRMMVVEVFSLLNYMTEDSDEFSHRKRVILDPVLMTRDSLQQI